MITPPITAEDIGRAFRTGAGWTETVVAFEPDSPWPVRTTLKGCEIAYDVNGHMLGTPSLVFSLTQRLPTSTELLAEDPTAKP